MTTFKAARLKGLSANLKANEITLTAVVPLSDDNMAKAEALSHYLNAKTGDLTMEITPLQPGLPEPKEKGKKE